MEKKQSLYSEILKLAVPIVVQNLLSAAVSSADVVMLNYVGQSSISAVSLASQYANILNMIFSGLGTGATILCAQYYGKKDMYAIRVVEGIVLRFSILFSLCFSLGALFCPELMMQVYTNDRELVRIGASYLRFMSVAYLCWGIAEMYLVILRSVGRVATSMALNILAFTMNIFLNAVFIFGLFGAPRLGASGVAIATSLSRLAELIGCLFVSLISRNVKLQFSYLFLRNRLLFRDFLRFSLPALGNDISWGLAFSMYSVILGHLGSDAVAANSLVSVVRNFGTAFCFGIAHAGGILLGNILGENQLEKAKKYASGILKLTVGCGAFGGLLILTAIPGILQYASFSDTALHYLKYMMFINSYYVMGQAVNTTLIMGVFRAGGDTRFGFICDTIDMWCYAVPLGFISAFVLKLPVLWVYFLICTDEFVKWPWVLKRYYSGKWLKNITRENLSSESDSDENKRKGEI